MGRQILRVGHSSEKRTMRMLAQVGEGERVCAYTRAWAGAEARAGYRDRGRRLTRFFLFRSIKQHWQDIDVHPFYTAYHRCRRRARAQFHLGHGKELFHCVLLRPTRTETLATRPSKRAFPIVPGRLCIHSSGFYIFYPISSSTEPLPDRAREHFGLSSHYHLCARE